jgi:hypothetical protein
MNTYKEKTVNQKKTSSFTKKRRFNMNLSGAKVQLNSFLERNDPEKMLAKNPLEAYVGIRGNSYYATLAESSEKNSAGKSKVSVDLWYESWNRNELVYAISLCYDEELDFSSDFPEYSGWLKNETHKKIWKLNVIPPVNEFVFQKDKVGNIYCSVYIDGKDESSSLAIFFNNEKIKKVIQKYSIAFEANDVNRITERMQQTLARIGQGEYREQMKKLWNESCAVTGCNIQEALIASHAKPWKICSDEERVDPHNGLLLSANLDALFDKGLITFDEEWKILFASPEIEENCKKLGIDSLMRLNPPKSLSERDKNKIEFFLQIHRNKVFNQ